MSWNNIALTVQSGGPFHTGDTLRSSPILGFQNPPATFRHGINSRIVWVKRYTCSLKSSLLHACHTSALRYEVPVHMLLI